LFYLIEALQWRGSIDTTVIERGADWANVVTAVSNLSNSALYFSSLGSIYRTEALASYANGTKEQDLLSTFQATVLPVFRDVPSADGYHSGNRLLRSFLFDVICIPF
jgi:hypothetical protein